MLLGLSFSTLSAAKETSIKSGAAAAHWIAENDILWAVDKGAARYLLLASPSGELDSKNPQAGLQSAEVIQLPLIAQPETETMSPTLAKFPHLSSGFLSLKFAPERPRDLSLLLKSELLLVALDQASRVVASTRPQLGGVLDELFAYKGELGLVLRPEGDELRLWAPTAQAVRLQVYSRDQKRLTEVAMRENQGVWSVAIPAGWVDQRLFYRYEIRVYHPASGQIERYEVSDPYAASGSFNGEWSQFLDLNDPDLKPEGWDTLRLPPTRKSTDMVIYEAHIRDFSARDASVPRELRGSYEAFTLNGLKGRPLSRGMQHLARLAQAGLTHVQILPAYDFGSVEEDQRKTINLDDSLARLCAELLATEPLCQNSGTLSLFDLFATLDRDGGEIARLNKELAKRDSFNWGYDPVHYGMPDGSYVSLAAAEREGEAKVLEFRKMVQGLAEIDLQLAMDVVYNHTYASGLAPYSVLDKVVPAYYHRLNPFTGEVERSSCCENTASERRMMEKLMIDTLQRWQSAYKVRAFRFDLMGLHFKDNMLRVKEALGPEVFIFGEGWAMGELNGDARRLSAATQLNMGNTGIGTFNDRFRDALRGGGPFDCGVQLKQQGPLQGLYFDDNGRGGLLEALEPGANCTDPAAYQDAEAEAKKKKLLALQDLLRLGLVGTLRDYELKTSSGKLASGRELDYGGQGAGYTASPAETINYVQNHDNQTFWDISQVKLPFALSLDERVRVHLLGLSFNLLAAGVPYLEMGTEFMRSKSLVRDSYNAGDWYNQLDFSLERSNWNRGLPDPEQDGANLPVIREVVKNVPEGPSPAEMQKAVGIFTDLLRIRKDSPLFRLSTAQEVQEHIDFLGGTESRPGIVAMRIRDRGKLDKDARYEEIVVIFNMLPKAIELPYAKPMQLHPIQKEGHDEIVKQSQSDGETLTVPARSSAVFVL